MHGSHGSQVYNTLVKNTNGRYYYDYEKALNLFDISNAESQFYIAECYYYGYGVPKDIKTASEYYLLSSSQRFSKAATKMASMIQYGEYDGPFEYDYENRMNFAFAAYKLGVEYDPHDANAKVRLAMFRLSELSHIYEHDSEEHIENQKIAIELLKSAKEYYMLGQLAGIEYMTDFSTPQIQITLYMRAAEVGCMDAIKHIADFLFEHNMHLEELPWWYWWAKKYDTDYSNDEIDNYIKNDELSKLVYEKMNQNDYYEIIESEDRRLYEAVHALWFKKALIKYYKDKLRSDYVSFSEKHRITRGFFEKQPERVERPVYDYETYIPVFVAATILSTKITSQKLLNEVILPLNQIELHKNNKKLRRVPASVYERIMNECISL